VSTVPPSAGPDHGATPRTTSETSSKRTPLAVYSRPLVLTSTAEKPAADAVVLHTSADSLTYAARTDAWCKRQRSAPSASAAAEKPPPSTVTGVPPSAAPRAGHTDETAAARRYVNATPLTENCWPLSDTSTRRAPDDDDGGAAHSSWPEPTRRAAAVAPLDSNRQRSVDASRKLDPPSTDTRVPPDTGPADGTTSLTCTAPCT
jgi:hypothetical protein